MTGPCAKVQVLCTIITADNQRFVGENSCNNPQSVCPRSPGEGYEKCWTVCRQLGHAEKMAIEAADDAGASLKDATAYVEYSYVCENCKAMLSGAGVEVVIGKPPVRE